MLNRSVLALMTRCLLPLALVSLPAAALAQAFPTPGKLIRIVVPFPAGGQTDIQARLLAAKLQPALGVTVLVDNKPGASSILGTMEVVRAPADGHTLLYTITVTAAQNPHLFTKLPYDPMKDLTPVMFAARSSTVLTVPANSPFNSVADLVKYAKANPGKLNYASYSLGSTSHLVAELMQQATGTQMTHIPFKGSADAGMALMGGQVDFFCLMAPPPLSPTPGAARSRCWLSPTPNPMPRWAACPTWRRPACLGWMSPAACSFLAPATCRPRCWPRSTPRWPPR